MTIEHRRRSCLPRVAGAGRVTFLEAAADGVPPRTGLIGRPGPADRVFGLQARISAGSWIGAGPWTDALSTVGRLARRVLLLVVLWLTAGLVFAAGASAYVYWTNIFAGSGTSSIGRANPDGTHVNQSFITGLSRPGSIAVDSGHIYWGDTATHTIGRANLDGTGVDQNFIHTMYGPTGVAVDAAHIYWVSGGVIGRANIDGTAVNNAFIPPGDQAATAVAVDANYIYWTDTSYYTIGRANIDGTAIVPRLLPDGLGAERSVAVEGSHVYWTGDPSSGKDSIGRYTPISGVIEDSFIVLYPESDLIRTMAVDPEHVYWTDAPTGTIGRANIDGTGINKTFITGASQPTSVAVDALSSSSNDLSASVALTGSDGKPFSSGSRSVGQTLVATVTLSAAAAASGPITGIAVDAGGLTVSPSTALKLVSGPSPAPPTTLSPGQSKRYVVTYRVVGAGQATLSVTANGKEGGAAQHATASATAQSRQSLDVSVTLARKSFRLALDKSERLVPKKVGVTVRIKNPAKTTVRAVVAQRPLFSVVGGAKAAKIPLKVLSGPKPSAPRDLKPGATIEAKYELEVSGDGTYDVQVLAIGSAPGVAHVAGVGTDHLTVGAPVLIMSSKLGRMVRSPDARSLVRAGTVFTVKLKLRNISYTHTLGIYPMRPGMHGNASDGHVETAGLPIQNPSLAAPPRPSEAFEVAPRTSREVEIIVRTTATYADVQSPEFPGGGTRAVVQIPTPKVADVGPDEEVLGQFEASDILVSGPKEYQVGIDDRDFRDPPPERNWAARAAYFSVGVFEGVWNLTGGVVVAVFNDLPLWLAKGYIAAPSAIFAYAKLEAELWDSIKNDPVKVALFLNAVTNTSLLAYEHAPALAGNIAEYTKKIDAMVLAHYTRLANDESTGNYYASIQEYAREGTEITGNLVLASGILTRLPAAVEALNSIKQASYVKVGEALNVIADGVGGRDALLALKQAVPGYEFLTTDLRKFYGLSEAQVAYLRGFAKENKLIITLRSRAEESLKWLNDGAVLKPEQIKIKTVSIDDINYLGYREGDLGRVVVRQPPSQAELARSLRAKGLGPEDPEWATAFKRLKDRTTEFNHPAYDQGYVKYLEDGAKNDELTLRWNLQQNSVDSSVLPNGYTKYGMRLLDEGGGNRVLQFCVDTPPCRAGSPGWRSVTGDVDFLSIVHADGSPLSVAERIAVYRQLAKSPVGMLHPAADTWTLIKRGQEVFDFAAKTNEFVRGGTAAQFGADGIARAVQFNPASRFTNAKSYRIFWNGGYTNVKRLVFR